MPHIWMAGLGTLLPLPATIPASVDCIKPTLAALPRTSCLNGRFRLSATSLIVQGWLLRRAQADAVQFRKLASRGSSRLLRNSLGKVMWVYVQRAQAARAWSIIIKAFERTDVRHAGDLGQKTSISSRLADSYGADSRGQ